jgi:hypothetical protein
MRQTLPSRFTLVIRGLGFAAYDEAEQGPPASA